MFDCRLTSTPLSGPPGVLTGWRTVKMSDGTVGVPASSESGRPVSLNGMSRLSVWMNVSIFLWKKATARIELRAKYHSADTSSVLASIGIRLGLPNEIDLVRCARMLPPGDRLLRSGRASTREAPNRSSRLGFNSAVTLSEGNQR